MNSIIITIVNFNISIGFAPPIRHHSKKDNGIICRITQQIRKNLKNKKMKNAKNHNDAKLKKIEIKANNLKK